MTRMYGATPFSRPMTLLRPQPDTLHLSQNRAVLSLNAHGFIERGSEHGFFIHETRLLSHYRLLINGAQPKRVLVSNVKQYSWLGYYILYPPGIPEMEPDHGSGLMEDDSERSLEVRVSRFVGGGLHEDIDVCNFSQSETSFELALEVDADFRDIAELNRPHEQIGQTDCEWQAAEARLRFHFQAKREPLNSGKVVEVDREASISPVNGITLSILPASGGAQRPPSG